MQVNVELGTNTLKREDNKLKASANNQEDLIYQDCNRTTTRKSANCFGSDQKELFDLPQCVTLSGVSVLESDPR